MDNTEIEKLLRITLLNIIKGDYGKFLDENNACKPVTELTTEQRLCIDTIDFKGYSVISKTKAIEMLSKIAGINSTTTKLTGGDDSPLNITFGINYVEPSVQSLEAPSLTDNT